MNSLWLVLIVLLEGSILLFVVRTSQQRNPIAFAPDTAKAIEQAQREQDRVRSAV